MHRSSMDMISSLDVMRAHPTNSPPSHYTLVYLNKTSTDLETVELIGTFVSLGH